jgi:cytochrome P450
VNPPFDQIIADGALAVIAGSDTTSTVLGNVFYNILANPEVYARLREEIDTYFPPGEMEHAVVDSTKLAVMPYLNAVM